MILTNVKNLFEGFPKRNFQVSDHFNLFLFHYFYKNDKKLAIWQIKSEHLWYSFQEINKLPLHNFILISVDEADGRPPGPDRPDREV